MQTYAYHKSQKSINHVEVPGHGNRVDWMLYGPTSCDVVKLHTLIAITLYA